MSSHDLEAMSRVAERVLVLRGGRCIYSGSLVGFTRGSSLTEA